MANMQPMANDDSHAAAPQSQGGEGLRARLDESIEKGEVEGHARCPLRP